MKNVTEGKFTIFSKIPKHGTVDDLKIISELLRKTYVAMMKVSLLTIGVQILRSVVNTIIGSSGRENLWTGFLFGFIPSFVSVVLIGVIVFLIIKTTQIRNIISDPDWLDY